MSSAIKMFQEACVSPMTDVDALLDRLIDLAIHKHDHVAKTLDSLHQRLWVVAATQVASVAMFASLSKWFPLPAMCGVGVLLLMTASVYCVWRLVTVTEQPILLPNCRKVLGFISQYETILLKWNIVETIEANHAINARIYNERAQWVRKLMLLALVQIVSICGATIGSAIATIFQ